jgi:hypothetical protein
MTTTQKALIAVALAAAIGTGICPNAWEAEGRQNGYVLLPFPAELLPLARCPRADSQRNHVDHARKMGASSTMNFLATLRVRQKLTFRRISLNTS